MRILKTLKPGQKGIRELLTRYGPNLLSVRYRYDEDTREAEHPGSLNLDGRVGSAARRRVALRIGWRETDLRRRIKSAGDRWDPVRRVWMLRRDVAEGLDLLNRVVGGGG